MPRRLRGPAVSKLLKRTAGSILHALDFPAACRTNYSRNFMAFFANPDSPLLNRYKT